MAKITIEILDDEISIDSDLPPQIEKSKLALMVISLEQFIQEIKETIYVIDKGDIKTD